MRQRRRSAKATKNAAIDNIATEAAVIEDTAATNQAEGDHGTLSALRNKYTCRETQIWQLSGLLFPEIAAIPTIVVHGLTATGKSSITQDILNELRTRHVSVDCTECITGRHLLERVLTACIECVAAIPGVEVDRTRYTRCESLSTLLAHLKRLLSLTQDKFVIVFDGIDQQREAPPTLEAALARYGEYIPNLSIILIVSTTSLPNLRSVRCPFVHFTSYNRDESLSIIARKPLSITMESEQDDNIWLWTRFCAAVWDSQAQFIARDVISFSAMAEKMWTPFVQPVRDGTHRPRDFSKLMLMNRALFQSDELLANNIIAKDAREDSVVQTSNHDNLSYYSKFLLCAAYLASFNPPRTDQVYFMRSSEKKRRKKGGGTRGRPPKHRKIARRLLAASPFPLERMLAIFHAILPDDITANVDLYTQIATLTSLRIITRAGLSADALDVTAKWRVNVGWDYVSRIGRSVGLELSDYAFEG